MPHLSALDCLTFEPRRAGESNRSNTRNKEGSTTKKGLTAYGREVASSWENWSFRPVGFLEELVVEGIGKQGKFQQNGMWAGHGVCR